MSYDHFAKRTSKGTSKDKRTAPRIGVPVYHFKRRVVHSDGESHPSEISPTGRIVGGCIGRGSGEPLHDHQETSERFTGGAVRKKGRMTNVGSGSVYDWHSESRISSREGYYLLFRNSTMKRRFAVVLLSILIAAGQGAGASQLDSSL